MKYFLLSLLFTLSAFNQGLIAQNNTELSIGSLYSNFSGLNVELSAKKEVIENLSLATRLSTNFNSMYGFRAGVNSRIPSKNKINLNLGVEYAFDLIDDKENIENVKSHNIEIPFNINYNFSQKYSLYGGFSSAFNLNDYESHRFIDNLRIGLNYKW